MRERGDLLVCILFYYIYLLLKSHGIASLGTIAGLVRRPIVHARPHRRVIRPPADRLRGRGPGRMYRKGDGRRLATFTSLPHSLTHSPLGLSSPHCQRTDSRSRQIICECGALSQPSPSPLPRCRRSRRRPSFSIPHPLTLTHTLTTPSPSHPPHI